MHDAQPDPETTSPTPEDRAQREIEVFRRFAVDMISISSEEELFWYVARHVVARLDFIDCVIYRLDEDTQTLEQMAAIGDKTVEHDPSTIVNRLRIPIGKGITGTVARSKTPLIVGDLQFDPRYISDLMDARSEICVPIMAGDQVLGVIDSEHIEPDHFTQRHCDLLESVAALTSAQLLQCRMIEEVRHARDRMSEALELSEQAQQSQARFLANASHELRTPLNAIVGFAGLLSTPGYIERDVDAAREFSENIKQSGEFLTKTFNSILDLAAIAGCRMNFHPDNLDAEREVAQLIPMVQEKAERAGLDVTFNTAASHAETYFDVRHLRQIVLALLDNAIKFSGDGKSIRVELAETESNLALRIHDEGLGIASEELDSVFEPFERGDSDAAKAQTGVGLGLAVARELARANGGDIGVFSRLGEGSVFTFRLPPPAKVDAETE